MNSPSCFFVVTHVSRRNLQSFETEFTNGMLALALQRANKLWDRAAQCAATNDLQDAWKHSQVSRFYVKECANIVTSCSLSFHPYH